MDRWRLRLRSNKVRPLPRYVGVLVLPDSESEPGYTREAQATVGAGIFLTASNPSLNL